MSGVCLDGLWPWPWPCRYQLSLYANLSKIVWHDIHDDSVVAGTHSDPGANSGAGALHAFRISTADKSRTQLVNAIWEQL